jgi:MscS family membrane protein
MEWTQHLPGPLVAMGPRGLAWWQWLALPLLLGASWVVGFFLGHVTRAVLTMLARRTKATWDDQIAGSVGRPLTLAWMVAAARALMVPLALPAGWQQPVAGGLRTGLYVAFFWFLLRVVTVGGEIIGRSAWAQARPASRSLVSLGARTLQIGVLAMAVVAILADLGFAVTSLLAGLGIGGLALALAGQKTVENLFGAFSIGVDQPFRVGDFIVVEGVMGTVEVIGLRSTRIRTLDRTVITMPNGKLADMRIESFAPRDRVRFACVLGLSRSARADQVRAVLAGVERALRAQSTLWPDGVTVRLKEITATSLDIEVQAWFVTPNFNDFQRIREELLLSFLELVESAGTSFAIPTRAVHVQEGKAF